MQLLLTEKRRQTVITMLISTGQVALASIAIPFFLNTYDPRLAVAGLLFTIAFWYLALVTSK